MLYMAIKCSYILYVLPFEVNKSGGVSHWVRGQHGGEEFNKNYVHEFYQFEDSILGYFSVLLQIKSTSYLKFSIDILTNSLVTVLIKQMTALLEYFDLLLPLMEFEEG